MLFPVQLAACTSRRDGAYKGLFHPATDVSESLLSGSRNVRKGSRLEARVCECYAVVKKEFDRLLPQ